MGLIRAVHRELSAAHLRDLEVVQIRVTRDALAGSPVAVALTPERARERCTTAGEPDYEAERWREILVHPDDWAATVRDALVNGVVTRMLGIEVVHDPKAAQA